MQANSQLTAEQQKALEYVNKHYNPAPSSTPDLNLHQTNLEAAKARYEQASQEQAQKAKFDPNDILIFDSNETAQQINSIKDSEQDTFAKIQQVLKSTPTEADSPAQDTTMTTYKLGARNTGIDYFDKKESLTLLDAYIAKQLGVKTARLEHKIDHKLDAKVVRDSRSAIGNTSKDNHAWIDAWLRGLATNIAEDRSSLTGAVGMKTREITRGLIGTGSGVEKASNNSIIRASVMQSQGGSKQISKLAWDNAQNEYLQADNIDKKAQVIKFRLGLARDALKQNIQRAQAQGAHAYAQKDLFKIAEIDEFIKAIDAKDYERFLQLINRKDSWAVMENLPEQNAWANPMETD